MTEPPFLEGHKDLAVEEHATYPSFHPLVFARSRKALASCRSDEDKASSVCCNGSGAQALAQSHLESMEALAGKALEASGSHPLSLGEVLREACLEVPVRKRQRTEQGAAKNGEQ